MDVDKEGKEDSKDDKDKDAMDVDKEGKDAPKTPEKPEEVLNNPSRVVASQMQVISFLSATDEENPQRYIPILNTRKAGFLILRNLKPDEPEDVFVEEEKPTEEEEKEPDPPEPFEWTDDQ